MNAKLSQPGFSRASRFAMVFGVIVIGLLILFVSGVIGNTTINLSLFANPTLEDDLTAHWTFDGTDIDLSLNTAEVRDRSGNGNHGNWIAHASTTAVGRIGQGISFDGIDDYISAGNVGTVRSVAFWVKPTTTTEKLINLATTTSVSNGYSFRRSVTIDNTKVSGSGNHSNFPVLVSDTLSDLATTGNSGKVENANGYDIIFTSDSDGAIQLDHEIESYNGTTGAINFWVEVPTLDFNDDTTLYMFYGSSTISSSQENVAGTWDSNFQLVQHLSETSGTHLDSTSNNNDSTSVTVTTQGSATGQVDGADDFDGTDDSITIGDSASLDITNVGTIEAWIKTDDVSSTDGTLNNWKSLTAPDGTAVGEYSNVDFTIVGDKRYYAAYLCNGAVETFQTADSDLDGGAFSGWTTRTPTGTCNHDEGTSIGIDSDGVYLYYAAFAHDGSAESFEISSSTLDHSSFSGWNNPVDPNGAGGLDGQSIDMTIVGDTAYLAAALHANATETFHTANFKLDSFTFSGWTSQANTPDGAADGESCGVGIDSDGDILYYASMCHDGTTAAYWTATSTLAGTTFSAWTNQPDPTGVGADDHSFSDAIVVGNRAYHAMFAFSGTTELFQTASSSLDGSSFSSAWISQQDGSGNPNGAGDSESADPAMYSDGKTIYYSAFANDDAVESFYVSSTTVTAHPIIAKAGAYELIQSGGGYVFDWAGSPKTFGTSTSAGTFTHVAVTHDGTTMRYYVDGVEKRSQTVTTDFTANTNNLSIGSGLRSDGSSVYFDGVIDEVRISNTARSVDWLVTQYNNHSATSTFYTIGSEESVGGGDVVANIDVTSGTIAATGFTSPTIYVDGVVTSTLGDTEWHHIVVTSATAITAVNTDIGKIDNTYFGGIMDDVRLYGRELDAADVLRLYQLGATTKIGLTLSTNQELESDLIGHWTFDGKDMFQNVADRSGQGNHGFLLGQAATTTVLGKLGQAIEFDGVNDHVTANSVTTESTSYTVAFWFYITGNTGTDNVFHRGDANNCFYNPLVQVTSSNLNVQESGCGGADYFGDLAISKNRWHHVVVTRDGTAAKLYLDNVLGTEYTITTNPPFGTSGRVEIGAAVAGSGITGAYKGSVDDVRIYNRAFSAEEISRIYELGATTKINTTITTNPDLERGLVAHWTFDGKDMFQNIGDRSGGGNNGALQGQTSTTTAPGRIGQGLEFDGVDDYVETAFSPPTGDFTYAAWVKPEDIDELTAIFMAPNTTGGNELIVSLDSNQASVTVFINGSFFSTVASDALVTVGEWMHVVSTRVGSDAAIYVDGALASTTTNGSTLDFGSCTLLIGVDVDSSCAGTLGNYFQGPMDDMRVYNRGLSAAEVKRLYQLGN